MKIIDHRIIPAGSAALLPALLAAALLLGACDGGGGGADTKTGFGGSGDLSPPTNALNAAGPLSAIGVAGIATTGLDDRASAIFINTQAGQSFKALKLGMVAEVTGTIPLNSNSTTSGTATNIFVQSAVVGPLSSVDMINQRVTILPLTIQIDQNTILEGVSSLAGLSPGMRVELYGLPQAESKSVLATRLILLPAISGAPLELVGSATNVSAFQFTVQGVAVSTGALQGVITPTGNVAGTSSIVENTRVRAIGNYAVGSNTMLATQVVTGIAAVRNDNSNIVLDGIVQSVGANGRFRMSDTDIETTVANTATISVGARVWVKGVKNAGLLMAADFRRIGATERLQYIAQGEIADLVSAASFNVRGESINASAATFVGGTAADLANGRTVRVKALVNAGRLQATEVSFVTN